jgi:hypothetical protein
MYEYNHVDCIYCVFLAIDEFLNPITVTKVLDRS